MYGDFAQVYDRLMADVDYPAWVQHYQRLMTRAGVKPGAQVVECACGTGNLLLPLAREYRMTGLDSSQEMLSVAAHKLQENGLRVPLVCRDMQRLRVHRPQDAVLATCDALNYLTTQGALERFLASAHAALKVGGALVFDVSSPHKLRRTLGSNTLSRLEGDVHFLWQNCWDDSTRLLHMRLHIYVKEQDGRYRLILEEQVQRAWDTQELTQALVAAGFEDIRAFGEKTMKAPGAKDARVHMLARKASAEEGII